MRRVGLVKGKVRRTIALASVFMLTCSMEAGSCGTGLLTSYGQETEASGNSESSDETEGSENSEDSGSDDGNFDGNTEGTEAPDSEQENGESDEKDESDAEPEQQEDEDAGQDDSDSGNTEDSEKNEESEGDGETDGQDETDTSEGTDDPEECTEDSENEGDSGEDDADDPVNDEDSEKETEDSEKTENPEEDGSEDTEDQKDETPDEPSGEKDEDSSQGDTGHSSGSGASGSFGSQTPGQPQVQEAVQANVLLEVQAEAEENWYLTESEYYEEDGEYYYTDAETKTKVTKAYIQIDGDHIIYVDESGTMLKDKWIDGGKRYVNGKGYLRIDEIQRAQDYYGKFDEKGYWTAIENVLFYDDSWGLWLYSGKDGKLAGPDKSTFYCLKEEADGKKCYEYVRGENGTVGTEPQGIGWLDDDVKDFYIDEDGNLLVDVEQVQIGDYFYSFGSFEEDTDEYGGTFATGNASLITSQPILDEGEIIYYVDENGGIVKEEFIEIEDETYYFGEDGTMQKRQWIEVETNQWRYVDSNGHMVTDDTRRAGGAYGTFDEKGYWTPKKGFFTENLDEDGTVTLYSDEEGDVAGPYDEAEDATKEQEMTFYHFVDEDGKTACYLMSGEDNTLLDDRPEGGIWIKDLYLDEDGYLITNQTAVKIGDAYYNFDAEGISRYAEGSIVEENGKKYCVGEDGTFVTNQFADDNNGNTLYFGADGSQQFSQWVEDEGERYYIGDDGYVVKNTEDTIIKGYYGSFDADGKWSAGAAGFVADDGKTFYCTESGKLAGPSDQQTAYYGLVSESGRQACYLFDENGSQGSEKQTNLWFGNYYIGADGYQLTDASYVEIDGVYYNFDSNGNSSVSTEGLFTDTDGKNYYLGTDGKPVINQFEDVDGNTLYFGADGSQQFSQWVEDEGERYYIGDDGYVVKNTEDTIIKGYYGSFDADGKWSAGAAGFVADDGKTFYCTESGKLAGPSDQQTAYYGLVSENGGQVCYLFDENGTQGSEKQTSLWLGDRYIGADGFQLTDASYVEIDGVYYDFDAEGSSSLSQEGMFTGADGKNYYLGTDGKPVTNQFKDIGEETLYFGEDGTQQFHQWVEYNGGFRYVDGSGHVIKDDDGKMAGGYYGSFDGEGYWTAISNQFFDSDLDDGTEVVFYSGEEGKVAGPENEKMIFYCLTAENERLACYLYTAENQTLGSEKQTNLWLGSRYVGADGYVTANVSQVEIDGIYYDFDENGNGTISPEGLMNRNGSIYYIGADGKLVTETFVDVDGETLYFGADGTQQFRQWIEDGNGFRYVNSDGHLIKDKIRMTGGYYGSFDSEGYWTAIEDEFFEHELDSGETVWYYSGAEGWVYRNSEGRFYCFTDDTMTCYLMDADGENRTDELVAGQWIEHLWVNGQGIVARNVTEQVDGIYYTFDNLGYGTAVTYQITYVLGDGVNSSENPSQYTGEQASITLSAPSRSGYTFDGWYTDSSYTNRITQLTSKDNSGVLTIYAKWNRNVSSSSGDSDRDIGISSSTDSASNTTDSGSSAATSNQISTAAAGESVVVSVGQTSVSSVVTQSAAGSVTGNTIVEAAGAPAVSMADGQSAQVATIAVGADGSTRSLLAANTQGTVIQQTVSEVGGVTVTRNVVVYQDGTQVSQKSGAEELTGFAPEVVAAEQAIQNGTMDIAAAYSGKVSLNLPQYVQVGSAVTYEVVPGVNGSAVQTQMEQTSLTPGQQLVVMITDAAGNVTVSEAIVGENGVIQYQIPGASCIVRLLRIAE